MRIIAFLAAALLAACTTSVAVPPAVDVAATGAAPAPGKYAVLLQTGGWGLVVKSAVWQMSACSVDVDLNASFETAMKGVLGRAVAEYELVPGPLTPAEVKARGYDGLVVIHQTNAGGKFWPMAGNMFNSYAHSEIALSAIIALSDDQGVFFQQQVSSRGSGDKGILWGCDTVAESVSMASKSALEQLTGFTYFELRNGLDKGRERVAGDGGAPAK